MLLKLDIYVQRCRSGSIKKSIILGINFESIQGCYQIWLIQFDDYYGENHVEKYHTKKRKLFRFILHEINAVGPMI